MLSLASVEARNPVPVPLVGWPRLPQTNQTSFILPLSCVWEMLNFFSLKFSFFFFLFFLFTFFSFFFFLFLFFLFFDDTMPLAVAADSRI